MSLTLTTKVLTKDEFLLAYDLARRGGLPYRSDIFKQPVSYININNIENASSDELDGITMTEYFDSVTKFDLAYIQKPSIIGIFDNLNKLHAFAVDHNLDNERRGEVVALHDFAFGSENDFIEYCKTEDDNDPDDIDIEKMFNDEIGWLLPKYFHALQRFYNNLKIDRVSNRKRAVIDYLKYLQ